MFRILVLFTGCSNEEKPNIEDQETSISLAQPEVIADELNVPWSIDKIGNTFFISERPGYIVKVENGKTVRQKVELEKRLATAAEAGLLGFVLAPHFNETNEAYAYYTYTDQSGQFNRIVTLRLENNVWKEAKVLLDQIPSGQFHHGGRLEIGPDGKLYATTGDAATKPEIAQDVTSLGGKILRMNIDGSIPTDNPFPIPMCIAMVIVTLKDLLGPMMAHFMRVSMVLPQTMRLIKFKQEKNYGWPVITGTNQQEGMETPLFTSGENDTWAPSGIAYNDGKLYVAALRGTAVLEFNVVTGEKRKVITEFGRIRDVSIEDNTLYFISNNTDGRGTPLEKDDKLYMLPLSQLNRQ